MSEQAKFYDEGWNAAHRGEPFRVAGTTLSWRDGWRDYQDAAPEHRKPFKECLATLPPVVEGDERGRG
jgi:hypothetical protein